MTSPPQPEYFPITKQELSLIKNDCFHPETDSCDGCEYASDGEMPCTWKGANALEEEILSRPYQSEQDTVLNVKKLFLGKIAQRLRQDTQEFDDEEFYLCSKDERDTVLDAVMVVVDQYIPFGDDPTAIMVREIKEAKEKAELHQKAGEKGEKHG